MALRGLRLPLAALLLVTATSSVSRAAILFDYAGGSGANPGTVVDISGFDWKPGNVLSVNALDANGNPRVGATITTVYQATASSLLDPDGNIIGGGIPGGLQISVVASFQEDIVSAGLIPGGGNDVQANFKLSADQSASYFRIYVAPAGTANDLNGTGFVAGTLIYDSKMAADQPNSSQFTRYNPPPVSEGLAKFDSSNDGDQYNDFQSVQGQGSAKFVTTTSSQNSAYLLTKVLSMKFNGDLAAPFDKINPSRSFSEVGVGAFNLGNVNGAPTSTNPDAVFSFQFQGDASSSFSAVPEPGTVASAVIGLLFTGIVAARRRSK